MGGAARIDKAWGAFERGIKDRLNLRRLCEERQGQVSPGEPVKGELRADMTC